MTTAMRENSIETACGRIPPLWPLQSFVAVNPFLGLADMPFEEAAALMERVTKGGLLMDSAYYLEQVRLGRIRSSDVDAVSGVGIAMLSEQLRHEEATGSIVTVADWLDQQKGTVWAAFITDEISKWCGSYFDEGQSTWEMPGRELSLYSAWKRMAKCDANPEVQGLTGFRQFVAELPENPVEMVRQALESLGIPAEAEIDFLHRELMSVFGWSAYGAYQDRQASGGCVVRQLLAIRLAYDVALLRLADGWRCAPGPAPEAGSTGAKCIAQAALEHAYRSRLTELLGTSAPAATGGRKALQAVFCIDVRSEVYRRALEAQSEQIQTIGFAGFFGMPIAVGEKALCPVLLQPSHMLQARANESRWREIWEAMKRSAVACLPTVEITGAWFAMKLLRRAFRAGTAQREKPALQWTIPIEARVDLAAGALKNMSLRAEDLAPTVLLCGHGSATENNPYAAGLDCGACGGHKGDINARFAAALFNDPEVRKGLWARGIAIPADTVFIAGLHITTTDEVELLDTEGMAEQDRARVVSWLRAASERARIARNGDVGAADVEAEVRRRSRDWSEVRPEWGLARNAAFIAAPRARTRHLDLEGRAFLHDYDAKADKDGSVLTLILTAPVIVASWINLQYYGSTVNNPVFGSGNKTLHNIVGTFGVWEGNGGDLRTGLPLQSLHDGTRWVHEPLRVQVFVEAPRERIDRIVLANRDLRNLVNNGWIQLLALEGSEVFLARSTGRWEYQTSCKESLQSV